MAGRWCLSALSIEMLDPAPNEFFLYCYVEVNTALPDQLAPRQGIGSGQEPDNKIFGLSDRLRWDSSNNVSGGNIPIDYRAGGDDGVGPDSHTGQHYRAVTDKHVIADIDFAHGIQSYVIGAIQHRHRAVVTD